MSLTPEPDRFAERCRHEQLERQVERASLFTHGALGLQATRLGEAEAILYGLLDVLLARGVVQEGELKAAVTGIRNHLASTGNAMTGGVILRDDSVADEQAPATEVDCAARMHICQAVCCRMEIALSRSEVEAGAVKWDLGRPYCLRRGADGYCTHLDRASGGCGVYQDRPGVCRRYSCANDERIWLDFERMILNESWIAEHLSRPSQPRFIGYLVPQEPAMERAPAAPAPPSAAD